jgi:hypothetical protein
MAKRGKSVRAQMPLRIPEALRARIERAAKKTGNSMNAEILERLEGSFSIEDRLGGPVLMDLIETVASVMKSTGQIAGFHETGKLTNQGQWLVLPYAFDQATKAANAILEHHRPPGEIVVPRPNVVQVVGEETEWSKLAMKLSYEELGELVALKEMRDREQEK